MHIHQIVPWIAAPLEPKKKKLVKEHRFFADEEPAATGEAGVRRQPSPVDDDDAERQRTDILA